MTPQEQAVYNALCDMSFDTNNGTLTLRQYEYRIGKDENTKVGRWVVSHNNGSYIISTNPNVGRFSIDFYLREV